MKNIFSAFILLLSVFIFLVNCSPRYLISKKEANDPFYGVKLKTEPMIIFNERFAAGGYTYTYPDTSADSYLSPHTQNAYKGEFSLKIGFDKTAHSGIGIVFSPVDVAAAKKNMTLEFWVKGVRNNVTFAVELIDSESDGKKTGATVPVSAFCRITTNWQKVSIPLNKFSPYGKWWDGTAEQPGFVDYKNISELRFKSAQTKKKTTFYVDDIKFIYDAKNKKQKKDVVSRTVIKKDKQNNGCYLGISGNGYEQRVNWIKNLEKKIGKKFAVITFHCDLGMLFPGNQIKKLLEADYRPHIIWDLKIWGEKSILAVELLNGNYDYMLNKWAASLAELDSKIILTIRNGNMIQTAQEYKKVFGYIQKRLNKKATANIIWSWNIKAGENSYIKNFPTKKQIEWVNIDMSLLKHKNALNTLQKTYKEILNNLNGTAVMVSDLAVKSEAKVKSLKMLGKLLPKDLRAIKLINWYNVNAEDDYRLNENQKTARLAAEIFSSSYFLTSAQNFITIPATVKDKWPHYQKKIKE